jgi:hypothetical protein
VTPVLFDDGHILLAKMCDKGFDYLCGCTWGHCLQMELSEIEPNPYKPPMDGCECQGCEEIRRRERTYEGVDV